MNKFRFTLTALAVAVLTLMASSGAYAQATRTWVSGVGDDVNPCSRTAPCKTFAGAISKTAAGGEINVLDPGGFGAVTITKSLTIDGNGTHASILASGVNGVVINDSTGATPFAATVVLRNLSINGAGTTAGLVGVNIIGARNVSIENCQIFGFRSGNGNGIRDTRNANVAPAPQLWVRDTVLFNNLNAAAALIGGTNNPGGLRVFLDRMHIDNNASHGIQAQNNTVAHVRLSAINGNLGDAVRAETGAKIYVVSSMMDGNLNGVNNVGGTITLADTSILSNFAGVIGTVVSFGNNNVRDNTSGNTLPAPVGQQ